MRIVIATDHYPPFIGGAQRQSRALARGMIRRGHDVWVATVAQPNLPRFAVEDGVPVHRLRQMRAFVPGRRARLHQPPFADPVTVLELRRLVHRTQPDVLHAAGWMAYAAAAATARTDTKLLLSARDYGFSCAKATLLHQGAICTGPGLGKCLGCAAEQYGPLKGRIATVTVLSGRRALRHQASALHSVSSYVDEIMARDFIGDAWTLRREVIPSFRDIDRPTPPPPGLPPDPYILFVGALRREKGVDELLEAHQGLDDPPPLVLIGTDDDSLKVPTDVTVLHDVSHSQVLGAWRGSLFGVMPSRWPEPLGSVVHEAMSQGRCVIGTRPGGHADMIDDEVNGLLVDAGDVDALRRAMQRLIANPVLRTRLNEAAASRADDFTADVVLPRFEALYEQIVARA